MDDDWKGEYIFGFVLQLFMLLFEFGVLLLQDLQCIIALCELLFVWLIGMLESHILLLEVVHLVENLLYFDFDAVHFLVIVCYLYLEMSNLATLELIFQVFDVFVEILDFVLLLVDVILLL